VNAMSFNLNHRRGTISPFEGSGTPSLDWPIASACPCTSLSFASCYVYSPRAAGLVAEASRRLCQRVKEVDPVWLPRYAGWVYRTSLRDPQLAALFTGGAVLVPVPGSAPSGDAPWAASQLAFALRDVGLAHHVWVGLWRQIAVRKSATAPSTARPTVREHYESFSVVPPTTEVAKVVLIDDVITKGRTLLAAAARLQAQLPHADVRAFALIRTQGFVQHMNRVFESCHGVVRWAGGDARREP
jgi:hypothetical protein